MDIQLEVNNLLDDICGQLLEQTPSAKEEIKEEIKTKWVDLLLFVKEMLGKGLVKDLDSSILRYVADEIEHRTKCKHFDHTCYCGEIYTIYSTDEYYEDQQPEHQHDKYYTGNYYQGLDGGRIAQIDIDGFHCMACGAGIRCRGRIQKVISTGSKYEVSRRMNAFR